MITTAQIARDLELARNRSDNIPLACPFCGGKAVVTNVRMSNHSFKVGCYSDTCWRPGTDFYGTEQSAIYAWNQRARTALPEYAEALREERETTKRLAYLLGEATKAVMHVSGPSHPLALEIREVLAAYHAQEKPE